MYLVNSQESKISSGQTHVLLGTNSHNVSNVDIIVSFNIIATTVWQ